MMRRPAKRLLLALAAPLLLLSTLFGVAEVLLALRPDPRARFLARVGSGANERFVASGHAPTTSSKLRTPEFTSRPAAGTIRVLALGDSTMYGVPFDPPTPFADWLALRLPRLLPGRTFEVVNLGASGMCSEDVLDLLRECGGAGASLLVVYVGHNEFLDVNLPRVLRPASHALLRALSRTRVGAALLQATRQPPRSLAADFVNRRTLVHDEPMLPPEAIDRGFARYRQHLEAIVELAHGWGMSLALIRPICDAWDSSPHLSCFASSTSRAERDLFLAEVAAVGAERRRLESAVDRTERVDAGAIDALLARLDALARVDGSVALLAWERGRLLLLKGARAAARAALQEALDRDGYPWRQPPRGARIVADIAARTGAMLVDPAPRFDAEAAPRLPDQRELFVDDVHPSQRGHELLAEAVLRTLASHDWIAPAAEWGFAAEPSIEEYRARADFQPAAQATALAREAFLLIGESHFQREARAALRAAQRKLDLALAIDAGCAEAHLGRAVIAAIRGDTAMALDAIALARARNASIDALLLEPWEAVPEMRSALEEAGLGVVEGRLVRRP